MGHNYGDMKISLLEFAFLYMLGSAWVFLELERKYTSLKHSEASCLIHCLFVSASSSDLQISCGNTLICRMIKVIFNIAYDCRRNKNISRFLAYSNWFSQSSRGISTVLMYALFLYLFFQQTNSYWTSLDNFLGYFLRYLFDSSDNP